MGSGRRYAQILEEGVEGSEELQLFFDEVNLLTSFPPSTAKDAEGDLISNYVNGSLERIANPNPNPNQSQNPKPKPQTLNPKPNPQP